MGVKTNLSAITFTTAGIDAAAAAGLDVRGTFAAVLTELNERLLTLQAIANVLANVSAEDTNVATIEAQITALS